MTKKIKPVAYGNTLVEFDQAVAILKSYGYTVSVEDEKMRYSNRNERQIDNAYVVKKDRVRPFVWSNDMFRLFDFNGVEYSEVFYACFQVLDNQVKDQRLKTALSNLDVGVF